jgi:hypothetical protein
VALTVSAPRHITGRAPLAAPPILPAAAAQVDLVCLHALASPSLPAFPVFPSTSPFGTRLFRVVGCRPFVGTGAPLPPSGCNGYGVDALGNCARLNTDLFDLVVTADAYGKDINGNPGRAAYIEALSTDARCDPMSFSV